MIYVGRDIGTEGGKRERETDMYRMHSNVNFATDLTNEPIPVTNHVCIHIVCVYMYMQVCQETAPFIQWFVLLLYTQHMNTLVRVDPEPKGYSPLPYPGLVSMGAPARLRYGQLHCTCITKDGSCHVHMYTHTNIMLTCTYVHCIFTVTYGAIEVGSPSIHIVCSATITSIDTAVLCNYPV